MNDIESRLREFRPRRPAAIPDERLQLLRGPIWVAVAAGMAAVMLIATWIRGPRPEPRAAGAPPASITLGKFVDDNRESLQVMRRATKLMACDWGLEYELGPNTPIAHLAKARVLGRLNGAEAARLAARGQVAAAVDVWLAGIRFSQHVA